MERSTKQDDIQNSRPESAPNLSLLSEIDQSHRSAETKARTEIHPREQQDINALFAQASGKILAGANPERTPFGRPPAQISADSDRKVFFFADSGADKRNFNHLLANSSEKSYEHGSLAARLNVVKDGAAEGVFESGRSIADTLAYAADRMSSAPLESSGEFLKNHWHEAAIGAAITFLHPPRWANVALMAYSMKGYAAATYDAFQQSADPNANLEKVKTDYARAIANESSAMVFSLPMTLAGGALGSGAANAVFGRNRGAIDLAQGKVKASEVNNNLLAIKDTVSPPPVRLVVADMDNTIAPFSRYYAQGFKQAVGELSQRSAIPEKELMKLIGDKMEIKKGRDYPWLLELALSERLKVGQPGGMTVTDFQSKLVNPFWQKMEGALEQHFKPYPTVLETLSELKQRNIKVAIVTDASTPVGLQRFTKLGIADGNVERMVTLDWKAPKGLSEELAAGGHKRVEQMLGSPHTLADVKTLPAALEKPNPAGLKTLLDHYGLRASEVLVIGDRSSKDVAMAVNAGARSVWAKYGEPRAEDKAIMKQLKERPSDGQGSSGKEKGVEAELPYLEAASTFGALLSHLNPKANYFAVGTQAMRAVPLRPNLRVAVGAYGIHDDKHDHTLATAMSSPTAREFELLKAIKPVMARH